MNFLRKVKAMLGDEDIADDTALESPTHDDITLTLQLSIPRTPDLLAPQDSPTLIDERSLAGQLLVATPVIGSGLFAKSVIYLFRHSAEGAAGLIINKPLETMSYDAFIQGQSLNLPRDNTARHLTVYEGGPVDRHRGFILHSSDYARDFNLCRHGELAVTVSSAIVNDIVGGSGPRAAALVVGYAGWGAGQLEKELEQNAWVNVPATEALALGTPDEMKWSVASRALGISDMAFYSTAVGHA